MTGGNKSASGPLAMNADLRELSALYEKKNREAIASRELLDSLEKASQLLAEELDIVRTSMQRQEKETLLLDQEMRKIAEESKRAAQKLSSARLELDRLARDSAQSRAERERKQALIVEKDAARSALEKALEDGRSELEQSACAWLCSPRSTPCCASSSPD